jgi:catalase
MSDSKSQPPSNFYTLDNGCPVLRPQASLRIGNQLEGPQLIRDINLLETISHIAHERIPERLVHAKGAGAWGEFEVDYDSNDEITKYTSAAFLKENGKKTPLFARFSTVVGERGSADSVRDARGFAFKIFTEEGNLDWLFFSTPTFPIRDGGKFPSFVHAQKRDPETGLKDASTFWDFMSLNQETFHSLMFIFSDSGTPKSYCNSRIFGVNTYKFTTKNNKFYYVKIHLEPDQGVANWTQAEAEKLSGQDPDAYTRELHDRIANKDYPSWPVYAQIIDPNCLEKTDSKGNKIRAEIFDPTKTISKELWPLTKFGKITLNRNPSNEFAEVEQVSFNPTAIVPGWDVSADPILQTRLFVYGAASRYRLGINLHQLQVNKPLYSYNPAKRDGVGYVNNLNPPVQPNYFPAEKMTKIITPADLPPDDQDIWNGHIFTVQSAVTENDWIQPKALWKIFLNTNQDKNFVSNVAVNLQCADQHVRNNTYEAFSNIDTKLRDRIKTATEDLVKKQEGLVRQPDAGRNRGGVGG